ncbi:vitamin K epoxide reductase family protein [Streptomyces palmae]|uniref:Vitamin K epoxide reductase family protein n=1 Tax=Streptomyces palmae TaxID=1701085 RepID=A0A4Z0GJ94_9ACTN|nr:vitamin K epoxide reductase family protein [Streptomyces palmae]TGA96886.1 vitamin K epoxide reductase family protein [Streptomyces palmae]
MTSPEHTLAPAPPRKRSPRPAPGTGASRAFAWLLVVAGSLGLLGSFVISIDKIKLLEDPGFVPGCSLNAVVSCTSVMQSEQASAFGFPNPLIGLAAFAVVIAIGFGLLSGATYPRWHWIGLNVGTLLGTVFCMWLMTQALYDIGALCLWCALVWLATIALFWYTTVHNIRHGIIPAPRALVAGVLEFHWALPTTWYLVIAMLVGTRFWSYWQTLL